MLGIRCNYVDSKLMSYISSNEGCFGVIHILLAISSIIGIAIIFAMGMAQNLFVRGILLDFNNPSSIHSTECNMDFFIIRTILAILFICIPKVIIHQIF